MLLSSQLADAVSAAGLLQPSVSNGQLLVDGEVTLGMTPTMESALQHGIAITYYIDIGLTDPSEPFWRETISQQRMRLKIHYDSLKQTYLLTNLSLQRIGSDRDLHRALNTLGAIQSQPIIATNDLKPNHTYVLRVRVGLDRDSLPNALRLTSLIDPAWDIAMSWQSQTWSYQP